MAIKNLIFDFDGTLVNTTPVILATMYATFDMLGLPHIPESECRASIGLRLEDIPARLFPEIKGLSVTYATAYRRIFNEKKDTIKSSPFPGVVETLLHLHGTGYRMAVASSRSRHSLTTFLEQLGVDTYFDMTVGGDDVAKGKPAPEPALKICDALDWAPGDTLVVGDADVDMLMGHAAGCHTCGVTYGNGTPEELHTAEADYLINHFPQLRTILGNLT